MPIESNPKDAFDMRLHRKIAPIRESILALLAVLAFSAPPAWAETPDPIDTRLQACLQTDQGRSTAGMAECTAVATRAWDARLNETYQNALAALDVKSRGLLRTAQRQWVGFRAAERAAQSAPWAAERGSIIRVQVMGANLSAIKQRVDELRLYLP